MAAAGQTGCRPRSRQLRPPCHTCSSAAIAIKFAPPKTKSTAPKCGEGSILGFCVAAKRDLALREGSHRRL